LRHELFHNATAGAILAIVAFLLIFPAVPVRSASTSNQVFSLTLLAPTSNPIRRQYSAIIAQQFESVGIGVNLIYVSFSVLIGRLFPTACPCGQSYDQGGFDVAFIGHGGGAPLPDFRGLTGYHSEVGAPLENYPVYKNTTVDTLIDKYQTDFNSTDRTLTGQQIIRDVSQDRPYAVIYYLADQYIFANYISPWKQQKSYTTSELPDVEHWAMTGGNTVANIGVTGDLDSVNYLASSASNTIYDLWLYGDTLSGLEYLNPIDLTYHNALATSITSNAAHTNYSITFRADTWSDGQPVTSDDFLYWMEASLNAVGTSVNLGTYQSVLGLGTSFKWLNGTTNAVFNGTLYPSIAAVQAAHGYINSSYVATGKNRFSFTVPAPYVFTDPTLTGISPLPKHILQQFPEGTWDTIFGSLSNNTPVTVSWAANPSEGVTAGSTQAYNSLIGNGPYLWHGYDPTSQTGTLVQNPSYWNLTGLQSAGYFQATTYHVVHVVDKSAALSSFATGQLNALDTNYQFNTIDKATAASSNGYMTVNAGPGAGSQEMGFNMQNPIFGTGTGTPVGQADPAKATWAARQVRHALSDLIPRQLIINNLLLGAGIPGITEMPISFSTLYPADVSADPYSPSDAIALLASAGYTGAGSSGGGSGGGVTPIHVGTINLTVPAYIVGQSFTFQGAFAVDAQAGAAGNGFAAILMRSTDNKTWSPTAMFQTTGGGGYSYTYSFASSGPQSYRVFLTGIPWTFVTANGYNDATALFLEWNLTTTHGQLLNTTAPLYGPQVNFRVGTLADVLSSLITQLNTAQTNINTQLNTIGAGVNQLNQKVGGLANESDVTNVSYIAYAAIAIAIILGLVAIFLARGKKS
jgi:ABC-type transport system substrate-binding protein